MPSKLVPSLLLTAFLTACSVSDGARTLVLIPNPVSHILYQAEKLRIRGPNESWMLFRDVQIAKETDASKQFWGLCRKHSYNRSSILPISGVRLLEKKISEPVSARGYSSPIDFYATFSSRRAYAHTAVEAIEREIDMEKLPISLEFRGSDGVWRKSSFDDALGKLVTVEIDKTAASHEIVFEQFPTGHEENYTIFGASMSVIDLATKQVVAENIGFRRDLYWGAHNHYRLLPNEIRCGYPNEENYVGTWVSSLVRKPVPGSINPYNGFKPREVVVDEDRHWSGRCHSLPPNEKWEGFSGTFQGEIATPFQDGVLSIVVTDPPWRTVIATQLAGGGWYKNYERVQVSVSSDTRIYTLSGQTATPADLLMGMQVSVWPADCGRSSVPPPEARYIGLHIKARTSEIKD